MSDDVLLSWYNEVYDGGFGDSSLPLLYPDFSEQNERVDDVDDDLLRRLSS